MLAAQRNVWPVNCVLFWVIGTWFSFATPWICVLPIERLTAFSVCALFRNDELVRVGWRDLGDKLIFEGLPTRN